VAAGQPGQHDQTPIMQDMGGVIQSRHYRQYQKGYRQEKHAALDALSL
jgi:hypothetical protein